MNVQTKQQLVKALAYNTDSTVIKEVMGLSDDDINSITSEEIESEKSYYKEMRYINE